MPVTRDMVDTWKGPGAMMRRLLARGESEPRALAILMGTCALLFVARLPALARQAHLETLDLGMLMGGSLMALIVFAPLLLYALALLVHWLSRATGGRGDGHGARLALFWSLFATAPLLLLNGLVAGFIGPGPALQLVGALWLAVFLWFWLSAMRVVREGAA